MDALAAAGEGSSFTFMIETVGLGKESAGCIGPSFLIVSSFLEVFRGDLF